VHLSGAVHDIVAQLIDVGRHRSVGEAVGWMIDQWFRQNEDFVRRVDEAAKEVRAIREDLDA